MRRSPVNANDLKVKFVVFFDKIGDYVKEDDIKACHGFTIIRKSLLNFPRGKYIDKSYKLKNNLKGLNLGN